MSAPYIKVVIPRREFSALTRDAIQQRLVDAGIDIRRAVTVFSIVQDDSMVFAQRERRA